MSDNNGSSTGTAEEKKECFKEFVVSDKFKKMIDEAFKKTKAILKQRRDDLNNWGYDQEHEFSTIFGIEGKELITMKYYSPGQQIDPDDAKPTPQNTPSEIEVYAYDFMRDGVERLLGICNKIEVGDRMCDENSIYYRYGNFLNETALKLGAARIGKGQTLNALPDKYKERIHIEILHRFKEINRLTGLDSRVSTLCHELSHLVIYKENGVYYGGMGTDDIIQKGVAETNANYAKHAKYLVQKKSKQVFNNAYNIEKYFEIKI
ncbi:hypothetical protein EK69_004580 [Salmonella enterica subsp. enterica]|nr:hypothetical protein [Salmonella enterica subsp. enterica serovar Baguida]